MRHSARIKVDSLPACPDGVATVVAIPVGEGPVLIGDNANLADDAAFFKLANWKVLLGKSDAELRAELATNSDLAKLLSRTTLVDVASNYFDEMLKLTIGSEPAILEHPQTILGIPPSTSEDQVRWRQRYKRRIERIFHQLGYPKPKFWPEPFAVFQYHLNLGEIRDVGKRQNVLIVDIGGGTTSICLIQTTQHGRLARGGINHVPHGVKSSEVGGATLDSCIAEELGLDGSVNKVEQLIKSAKENLSGMQDDWNDANLNKSKMIDWNDRTYELTASQIKKAFVSKVWPAIDATLDESLEDIDLKKVPVDKVDIVILAGGTCQMGLVLDLVKNKLSLDSRFKDTRFIVSANYRYAVAHGLAIEAAANSRHHDMMPSRVSAYLQEDLLFECGHNGDSLYIPHKLKSDFKSLGDLAHGILLKAPKEVGLMLNRPRVWKFRIKQNSRELFYRFSKLSGAEEREVLLKGWRRISRSPGRRAGRQLELGMTLQEDGFAKLAVGTSDDLSYQLDPIDLHDLSELEGDTFFALDFGTDNTQVAYVNIKDPDLLEPLPTSYIWDARVKKRVRELIARAENVLSSSAERGVKVEELNEQALTDYVYHSNRIEGSLLDRGDTERILDVTDVTTQQGFGRTSGDLSNMGIIDEHGEITSASMLVKDKLAAVNLRDAFHYVEKLSNDTQPFNAVTLRQIHELVMRGDERASPGSFRKENVAISQTTFVPPDFVQIDQLAQEMFERFNSNDFLVLPPIIQAVEAHARFVSIHPFADGNGRVARLLANYFMWRQNLPGFLLPWENRERYYDALEECNSKEPGLWGNLTDLIALFCDVFEVSVEQLEDMELEAEENSEESTVVDGHHNDTDFSRLIEEIKGSGKATPLKFDEQYDDWSNKMSAVVSEIKELSAQLSRAFRTEWQGEVYAKDYPIIDIDTYRAIRTRQRYSRTWCIKIVMTFLIDEEEIVFYFGNSSRLAEELNPKLKRTCSLHISIFDREQSRHVDVSELPWSRLMEITHDGSNLGVIIRDLSQNQSSYASDERAWVANWFGMLVKDLIEYKKSIDSG